MPEPLDLVALRSLTEIAEAGSFTGAARSLGISQPAVSQHVRALETRFSTRLVHRDGRRMVFTTSGERVLAAARRLLSVHDEVVRALEPPETPPIVVGCIDHAVSSVLPGVLAELGRAAPARRVVVHVERAETLSEGLRDGWIDVAVVLGGDWSVPGDEAGRFELRWVTAAAGGSETGAGAGAETSVPLVVSREPCRIRNRALSLVAEAGIAGHIAAESSTLEGVVAAARTGLGVALLPMPHGTTNGFTERAGLPEAGSIPVRVVAGERTDPEIRAAALRGAINALGAGAAAPGDRVAPGAEPHR
ncbi:LysR family transcriptional regulator [Pseudoclavibacter endophyticus]|uniref:LysR family transcriptional regulator n=1 Tax=Pseudoclavibacter endophyticus TaxID=1778590 RepID=A0A6H9WAD2_9MICO|nr:LysR family transcriptional regulator [Pseudoclavibacter endophyticus]KAB1646777.1 LysR family transcriptional regulator [Pseudoclavibacter endophyticus]GGA75631.1 LysR family transcriptional regulator [Pseudoclavibacter endophyticus]